MADRRNSNSQLLEELETLSQSLYQSHTTRRTASLALPRSSAPPIPPPEVPDARPETRGRSRRMSMSPWRSRPKQPEFEDEEPSNRNRDRLTKKEMIEEKSEKKGIWNWKPIRALSHITMQKLSCLFSVEVIAVQNLPASMNGLRLSVSVRKKESRDGVVQTMPARVLHGSADFEETLFIKCHVYCDNGGGGGRNLKFEPRPFVISVIAVDAEELNFGKSVLDLSSMIQESMEKSVEGTRIRQWDMVFDLQGKAKGGELVMKLGFQIMEKDGGLGIYNQAAEKSKDPLTSLFGRKQSKYSFSVTSPRISSRSHTPLRSGAGEGNFQGIDDLNLDEPAPIPVPSSSSSVQKSEPEAAKMEDLLDLPEFEVVDKGIEIEDEEGESLEAVEEQSAASSEVVKEIVVHDEAHQTKMTELDLIAQQIKALESLIRDESGNKAEEETGSQRLDAEEETVTREFLQMLEAEDKGLKEEENFSDIPLLKLGLVEEEESKKSESKVFVPDLGKGLGSVVQTRDGGYLAAMNPFDTKVSRKVTPKLAMQISKPLILPLEKSQTGFEVFQKMAGIGIEELSSKLLSAVAMDELMGKTAEQIAFEGVASAIIHGRNKEGASSSAARSISMVKNMATAMTVGRKERISTGIWNVSEDPVTVDEILGFSLQKLEAMTVEALKIQAEIAEEDAPFDISNPPGEVDDLNRLLDSALSPEDWEKKGGSGRGDPQNVMLLVVVQLRDPLRQFESVGAPVFGLVQANNVGTKQKGEEEEKFKVGSLHMGGLKLNAMAGGKRDAWGGEKQRLTAMHWLVAYGLRKAGKKGKNASSKGQDSLWSISARVMADMWLKPMRNPDLKFPKQQ